eukprot:UN07046
MILFRLFYFLLSCIDDAKYVSLFSILAIERLISFKWGNLKLYFQSIQCSFPFLYLFIASSSASMSSFKASWKNASFGRRLELAAAMPKPLG